MNDSVRLGRIAGIPIGINWTWLIVFVFFAASLAYSVFPATNPGLGTGTYVAMAIAAELLFFASLLLHELGHAVVARREGVAIDGVTLWLFGGVARMRGMFPSAGAEFRIAIAGPVVTAVLAAGFVGLALLTRPAPAVDGVVAWLGYINLLLLGFNLLPALPLDGGRVLRAALWKARGDFGSATRVSALVGRGFGGAMIVGGLIFFVFHGAFGDLWIALLGWFLLGAARSEARLAVGNQALAGIAVADVMTPEPVAAGPDLTLQRFMDHVAGLSPHRAYPVVDNGSPLGLLVASDVAKTPQRYWSALRVHDLMTPLSQLPVVSAQDSASEAFGRLVGGGATLVLVLDRGALVGVVALSDLASVLDGQNPPPRAADRVRPIQDEGDATVRDAA